MNKAAAQKIGARSAQLIVRIAKAARKGLKSRNTCWLRTCIIFCASVGGWLGNDLGEMAGGTLGLAIIGPVGGWLAEGGGAIIGAFVGGYLGKVAGKYISNCLGKMPEWRSIRRANSDIISV